VLHVKFILLHFNLGLLIPSLQHALADLGPFVKRYKKAVEESFGDIKHALSVEDDQVPHLPADQKQRYVFMLVVGTIYYFDYQNL